MNEPLGMKPGREPGGEPGSENRLLDPARRGKRLTPILLLVVLGYAIYPAGLLASFAPLVAVGAVIRRFPPLERLFYEDGLFASTVGVVLQSLLAFAPIYLLLWAWLRFYEKRPFSSLGLKVDLASVRQHLRGVLVALAMVGAWVAIQAATGHLAFGGRTNPEPWGLAGFGAVLLASSLGRAFQIGIEEALFRGWVLQAVGGRRGAVAGVLFSSASFALWHFFQPMTLLGMGRVHDPWPPIVLLNIFLWAVFAALWALREGSLWGVIAFHATSLWAYDYVFGFGGSPSVLDLRLVEPSWLTGGVEFSGPFEGLPATAVLGAGILVLLLLSRRRRGTAAEGGPGSGRDPERRHPVGVEPENWSLVGTSAGAEPVSEGPARPS